MARAVILAIKPSKTPNAAAKAVSKLICNQGMRLAKANQLVESALYVSVHTYHGLHVAGQDLLGFWIDIKEANQAN